MKVLSRNKVEDCFDGSSVFDYAFSEPWTAQNARCLEPLGAYDYFADFPRPLFRLKSREGLFVSGVVGSTTCRVILPRTDSVAVQQKLEEALMLNE